MESFIWIYTVVAIMHLILAYRADVRNEKGLDQGQLYADYALKERQQLADQLVKARAERDELANRLSRSPKKRKPYHVK